MTPKLTVKEQLILNKMLQYVEPNNTIKLPANFRHSMNNMDSRQIDKATKGLRTKGYLRKLDLLTYILNPDTHEPELTDDAWLVWDEAEI